MKPNAFSSLVSCLLLAAAACEGISSAPKGSPRVEVEIALEVDDSYTGALQGSDEALRQAIAELVRSKGDIGLRFYPVLSDSYQSGDNRPPYVLNVKAHDLNITVGQKTIETGGGAPKTESVVERLECRVSSRIVKRRAKGPELLVASSSANKKLVATRDPGPGYAVATSPQARVSRTDLLAALDAALTKAFRELVPAVDRELALESLGSTRTGAVPATMTGPARSAERR